MNARHQPHIFSLDYERSLRAAFLNEEFYELATRYLPQHAKLVSTFKVPFLIIIKKEDKPLPPGLHQRINLMRDSLKPRYRQDMDNLRLFLRLGGLKHNPFK